MNIRKKILKIYKKYFQPELSGDAVIDSKYEMEVSCIINFYGRAALLRNILASLASQVFDKERFEVLLVEDRGGTDEGRAIAGEFSEIINIRYIPLEDRFGTMGHSRNVGIEHSKGKYILLLDDDTVILQKDFLEKLVREFEETGADGVLPRGNPSFCITEGRYQYHERYFPTNRCVAYSRDALKDMCGFVSDIVGQEDVEFTVRLALYEKKLLESVNLDYFHPPLIVENSNKSSAVGYSFWRLRKRYPFFLWLMLVLNGCRYLPLYLLPLNEKYRHQARFSLGFVKGLIYSFTDRDVKYG